MPKRRQAEIANVGKLGMDLEDRLCRDEIHEASRCGPIRRPATAAFDPLEERP
jgi:hypothetical protein